MLKGQERLTGMAALKSNIGRSRTKRAEAASCVCNIGQETEAIIPLVEPGMSDIVLHFQDHGLHVDQKYQCSREVLRYKSSYFDALLDPAKFSEGIAVEEHMQRYGTMSEMPVDKLPTIVIRDVGELPANDPHNVPALTLFLHILHDGHVDGFRDCRPHALTVLALLASLAERFDAVRTVSHLDGVKYFAPRSAFEPVLKSDTTIRQKETYIRQKLLAGMVLDDAEWVRQMSATLICEGSANWASIDGDSAGTQIHNEAAYHVPLWWMLPHGMEEELHCRHEYVLETISSLQEYFLGLYISKERQCKLGYDTSPQCDSFQLGQMVRFLQRKSLLQLQSTYAPCEDLALRGDVSSLLDRLRQAPSYQLDGNHVHCGLRSRLLPLLDRIMPRLQVGICLKCWNDDRSHESWVETPSGGSWVFSKTSVLRWDKICSQHRALKAMYTAEHRNWTYD